MRSRHDVLAIVSTLLAVSGLAGCGPGQVDGLTAGGFEMVRAGLDEDGNVDPPGG